MFSWSALFKETVITSTVTGIFIILLLLLCLCGVYTEENQQISRMLLLLWSLCVDLCGSKNMNNISLNPIPHYFGAISSAGCHTILRTSWVHDYLNDAENKRRFSLWKENLPGPKQKEITTNAPCIYLSKQTYSFLYNTLSSPQVVSQPIFKNQSIIISTPGIDFVDSLLQSYLINMQ